MTLPITKPLVRRFRWLSRIIAIIALLNLLLVFFDLSYIPWRDYYLKFVPQVTQLYDPIKGIEPHRDTEKYLNKVNELEVQVKENGLESPSVGSLLAQLQILSDEMIQENPFALANKSGQLEKIKNKIRDRIGNESARESFYIFWSQPYLTEKGWPKEISFFNRKIRPRIETNYFRHLGTSGNFLDNFWLIDLPFIIVFGLDFLVRTFLIQRDNPELNLQRSILRHWYDIFLLLPFFRWWRVIPVLVRLHQTELIDLEPIREQINHDFVSNFAEELTEVVGVEMIDQMQRSIRRGDVTQWLFHPENRRTYIDINNTNEVQAIASRIIQLSIYEVFPKIQLEVEALVQQIIEKTLNQSPVYQQLENLPGVNKLRTQLTENLAKDLSQTAYNTLTTTIEDPEVAKLSARLVQKFQSSLEMELQKKHHQKELESLIVDMLEEIKINYVKGIAESGVERSLAESEELRQNIRR